MKSRYPDLRQAAMRTIVAGILLLIGAARVAEAQSPSQPPDGSPSIYSVTVQGDRYWIANVGETSAGGVMIRGVEYKRQGAVAQFGVGVVGTGFTGSAAHLAGEAGAGYMLGGTRGAVVLEGGASGLLATHFRSATVGGYLGLGGVLRIGGTFGLRVDLTRRFYLTDPKAKAWVMSAGIGVLPWLK